MILLFVACSRRKTSRSEEPPARYKELQTLLPGYAKRLKKKGVTRQQLFQEYRSSHPDGYARSRFCNYFQAYLALSHPVAHLEHKAGDKMFIDHAGDKLALVSMRDTGQTIPVEVFVSILPCSQLTYVEAVMSQRKEDLIHACESALLFYGGNPGGHRSGQFEISREQAESLRGRIERGFRGFCRALRVCCHSRQGA